MSSPFANEEVRTYVRDSESDISQLKTRVKELEHELEMARRHIRDILSERHAFEAALSEERKKSKELEAENAELRNRGAVYYGLQKDEGRLLMNTDTEQLEIYDSLRAAHRAVGTGQKIIQLRVRRGDEGEA